MIVRTIIFAIGLLASTASVAAQTRDGPPGGKRVPRAADERGFDAYTYSRKETDREFAAYSECLIRGKSGERQAAAFLRMVPTGAAWNEAGRKLSTPQCLGTSAAQVKLRFNLAALRPALFAAMYRRNFGGTVPTSFNDAAALTLDALYDGPVAGFPPAAYAQLSFGNCVARADAAAAHRLLMAKPWSNAEDAALPAVTQAMGGCLSQGQTLRLNRSGVRNVLAEAMYQLSSARVAGTTVAAATGVK